MNKIIKRGKLYRFPIPGKDIDSFLLPRVFRKFKIDYIPFTLRYYDQLFLREDRSKYSRKLVAFCKKHGIETFVVQEGLGPDSGNPHCSLPFRADYFLCPPEDKAWWIEKGIPKDRIQVFRPIKQKHEYSTIFFLNPFYQWNDFHHPFYFWSNVKVMQEIEKRLDQDVIFRPHKKNIEIIRRLIHPGRLLEGGDAKVLMNCFKKVICFSNSTIVKDCQDSGITPEIIIMKEPV